VTHRTRAATADAAALRDRLIAAAPLAAARPAAIRVVRAPGRVNLIGEHTDYNDGLVLPAAIDLEVRIAYVPSDDGRVQLTRADSGRRRSFHLDHIGPKSGSWIDYPAGTAWALREAGLTPRGLHGVIGASLPAGAGLSSSAAIELASAWALLGEAAADIEPMHLAQLAQRAENRYVGVNCGLMDQFASACGVADAAVLLDCRSLEHLAVPLPLGEVAIVICDTGSARRLEASEYNLRRSQCETAVAELARTDPSVRALRDVTRAMLPDAERRLDPLVFRRVRHVVTEDARVTETIDALRARDLAAVGRLFAESHASLRDDYEVSSPALDAMVSIAASVPGVIAARMTGAGFGGSTVNLVRPDAVGDLRAAVLDHYPRMTGLTPTVRAVRPADGAGFVG
jgi:galactokinase